MKQILRAALALALTLTTLMAAATAVKDVENVHLTNRTRYVTDMASALTPEGVAMADSIIAGIWRSSTAEPVVVVVPDLDGEDINDYATDLFTAWGLGKKDRDNGVLVLISVNDRQAAIRTGYGAEGALPDALCWGIIRNDMAPAFKNGDYDRGLLAALMTIDKAMTDPDAREELMSAYANDSAPRSDSGDAGWTLYLVLASLAAGVVLMMVLFYWIAGRRQPAGQLYSRLERLKLPAIMVACLSLGIGLPALLALLWLMRRTRLRERLCPNCHHSMNRLDEQTDNLYLTPAQDAEERLNSVDYDVWLCPNCGETDIIPYVNPHSPLSECPRCHARAAARVQDRVFRQPTTRAEGIGEHVYACRNCGNTFSRRYTIPKVVAPPVIITPGGGFGGGGGGGFGGGSFGGGMTGGGGSTGSW